MVDIKHEVEEGKEREWKEKMQLQTEEKKLQTEIEKKKNAAWKKNHEREF